ncbi:response regulator transcription factor [Cohnella sp. GCM10012308]|uniref:response regulator transcription factor n=1 Tax=Cohnella sp. GCM10012308 TaxID=3317329 RepID=UPI00361AF335
MNPTTILIADDEKEIADLISLHLQKEGYRILLAHDGKEAVRAIETQAIDLAVLDIMMPELDGFEVVRQIRERHRLPVLFVSAKTSDFDKISGLVIGADDYMTKPFNPMELVARVQALLRRSTRLNQARADEPHAIESGGLAIVPDQRRVTIYGDPVELTPKEFDILCLLASHPRKVFGVEQIFQQVWGEAYYEVGNNTVMVHIRTLRKKLGEDKNKDKWIKTIWGVGYTFNG